MVKHFIGLGKNGGGFSDSIADSITEITTGAMQISNAETEISDISQTNKHSIEAVVKEVNKFKV